MKEGTDLLADMQMISINSKLMFFHIPPLQCSTQDRFEFPRHDTGELFPWDIDTVIRGKIHLEVLRRCDLHERLERRSSFSCTQLVPIWMMKD